jgi:hypothetical protein
MKSFIKLAAILFTLALALPARASENHDLLQARLKTALNDMVQEVKSAGSPAAKRAILGDFLAKVESRVAHVGRLPFLSGENRAALAQLEERFGGYSADLRGGSGRGMSPEGVADKDLDAFASFMQQDLEQAAVGGGVYLSTGAVIIILLILILIL